MTKDEQHLNLLSIFYYVVGSFSILFALIPIIHLVIGIMMLSGTFPISDNGQAAPPFLAWFFISLAIVFMAFGAALAVVLFLAAGFLKKRKRYNFCFIAGIVSCLFMPVGTILGIFTIIVLSRPNVKQLFQVT
jgi:hypothetical protein